MVGMHFASIVLPCAGRADQQPQETGCADSALVWFGCYDGLMLKGPQGQKRPAADVIGNAVQPSKTRRMIWRVTIGIILVITGMIIKYLSEVFHVRLQETWSGIVMMAAFFSAIIWGRH